MSGIVENWLGRFAPSTAETYGFHFRRWMGWMAENGGDLAGLSPEELAEYQRDAGNGTKYVILDLLQRHVREIPGRYHYKMKPYTAVRSFFVHNRADLPPDKGFILKAETPPVEGTLTLDETKRVILASNPLYQAVFLCILQGGMDERGIVDWSKTGYDALIRDLPEIKALPRESRIIRIKLPGRKKNRNKAPFYTYIGADAIEAVENWLRRRPGDAEAIFCNQYGEPLTEESMRTYWTRKLMRLGLVEPGAPGDKGNRYGKNLHEGRDVFRSQWEKSPAKGSVGEYMMGHQIDPLEYNKACRDEAWTLKEYRKALPYLQIISSGIPFEQISIEEAYKLKNETVADLQRQLAEQQRLIEEMAPAFRVAQRMLEQTEIWDALRDDTMKPGHPLWEKYSAWQKKGRDAPPRS